MNAYAELHCLSNFTFLRGASHPEELVDTCPRVGLCGAGDHRRVFARGYRARPRGGEGMRIEVDRGQRDPFCRQARASCCWRQNRNGYGNLSELITQGRRNDIKGRYSLALSDIQNGLPGCLALLLPDPLPSLVQAQQVARHFPGRSWLAVELFRAPDDTDRLNALG